MMDWETREGMSKSCSNLKLTDTEHRYYGDIFIYCCENGDTDQVQSVKVGELLRTANLPSEVTLQILDICGGAKNNFLTRKQFYAALKLVAAHQAGLEVHKDLIFTPLDDIALPRFKWPSSTEDTDFSKKPFSKRSSKPRSANRKMPESTTDSESEAESPRGTEGGSTDSPTPTNSVTQERNDGVMGVEAGLESITGGWQSLLVSEEQRQLLGTEEESSERHSSDDGEEGESFPPEQVWEINDEQREYYAGQFEQLQPNPEGLLSGSLARKFFEKSRLPVEELRKIWQLADVTRDSALSLQEFYVAMHLAVVRRNHVPLPDVLPTPLVNILKTQKVAKPPTPPPVPPIPAPRGSPHKDKSKEWTKFVDSPTGNNGSLTSPGPKPVNFDFQKAAVERDPKILHPVPLRLTPEAAIIASNANGASSTIGDEELQINASSLIQRPIAKKSNLIIEDSVIVTPKKEPPPPPPPRPYKMHARSSSLDLNKLGKNGQTFLGAPPLVPPRISPGITSPKRLICQKSEEGSKTSNTSEQSFIADFSQFNPKLGENQTVESSNSSSSQKFSGVCGAFHIYKKPISGRGSGDDSASKDESETTPKLTLQELREVNTELRQACEELTAEWAGALQERINLKAKLLLLT